MSSKKLSERAMHGLIFTSIACGRFGDLGMEEAEALQLIQQFCEIESPRGDPDQIALSLFNQTQNALMAFRKDDFYTIQKEAPFSDFGKANLTAFLKAWRAGGKDAVTDEFNRIFINGRESRLPPQPIIRLKGGDGLSPENAVIIEVGDLAKRIRCEYWYINYIFGEDHELGMHMTTSSGDSGKMYSMHSVTTSTGREASVYFDISNQKYD